MVKESYVGQVFDPTGQLPGSCKYFLMLVYVENDDKLQMFCMQFSTNSEEFQIRQLPDLTIWQAADVTKPTYNYSFENQNQIYQMLMTHQHEADKITEATKRAELEKEIYKSALFKKNDKQQLIVCTNSGIKVYEISLDQLAEQLKLPESDSEDFSDPQASPNFLKYKLSALPNEKILDIVYLRSASCQDSSSFIVMTNLGQYVLLKSDTYLVQWRFQSKNTTIHQKHTVLPPIGLINFL